MNPVFHTQKLFRFGLAQAARRFRDHFPLGFRNRPGLVGEALDGGVVAVGRDESCKRFDEMPRRAVQARLVAGVHVLARPAAPAFTAGNQLALDDSLRAQRYGDFAVEPLRGARHENSEAILQGPHHLRPAHNLRKVRRADFLFSLGNEYQIHGQLVTGAPNRV